MPAWAPPVRPQDVVGTGHKWLEPVDQEGVHKGVDLQLTKGKPALSPVDGVVSDVGNDPQGLGITVTIRDAQGTETKLGHLDGVHVKVGDHVKQGQQVADVGSTGASTGSHLDVRMQDKDGQYQDPTAMLGQLAQMPRADQPEAVGAGQEDDAGNPIGWAGAMLPDPGESWGGHATDPRYGEFAQGEQPGHWNDLPPAMPWGGVPSWLRELSLRYNIPPELIGPDFIQQMMPIPPHNESPWWTPDYPGEGQDRASVGVGQGMGRGFTPPLPAGGVYGAQKWSSPMGSNAVDIFVRRGTPVVAPTSGTLQQGMNGQLILVGDQGTSFAFRHGQTTASGHVQEGQTIGYVNDPGLDSLGRAPWGNMPDNYQHLEMSVSQGSPSFPATPGGGGNVDAAQWLNSIGYSGNEISKTPGPPDAGGGGFGGQQGFGGFPGMGGSPFGGSPFGGMGMGMPPMGFPGMPGGLGMMGGGQFGMGMGMPGMPGGMGQQMGMTSPMGMGMPGGAGMFGDPSAGGGFGGMDPGLGMSTGMGAMDPMAMGAGPMGDFSGWGGSGGGSSGMSSMFGGLGQSGFGGFGGQQFGGMGQQGMGQQGFGGGQQFGGAGGLGSQMQTPAFSGYPGAMPSGGGFGGPTGNPVTMTAADNLMQQELAWKPDWTGVNAAQDQLKKNATTPLGALPINTHQLSGAPQSTLKPWDWLNQIYPGSGQDRAPVGSGQDRSRWDVGVGQSVTPTNTPFQGTLTTDPGQAVSGNLNQQYFQLAQQQLQQQIQQVNQQFNQQQQQLAQQASQFGMTTQLAQQQQELQQKQFDANQQLQRQLAELQNAQLQQNLGIQVGQFNQQMGLQGAQLGLQAGQFNQQMGLQGAQLGLQAGQFNQQMGLNAAQLGLQQQQLGMLPQQLAAQYGLSAAQLGQGQQQMGIQVQQLNQQYQQAQQAAYQSYLTSGNQDQYQRELANMNARFQQGQAQIQQAQYGGNMQLQQQQLRGQTGLSLAQMAQQQQQAGFGRQMDIFNSAMANPWLQQLSGMAPQWGAAGGPQEAGQAAAAGMPNMPSQGGGINLPDLMQYFPDINVQQYLQGQTPQMGASPFQQSWQSVMSGLGQYNPYTQGQITMPENPFPFQMPQFSVGQNPYPFNFQPVSSSFNFQPVSSSFNPQDLTVPLEGQMPWAANPGPPDPNTMNPPGNNNGYQAGPLTFTGQGSMGTPPTGYNGGGSTYTLPNGQTFTSQDVWNWEQSNQGSSPDQAYQYEMGQHGFPGWNFPIGDGGGFPVGSTVGWNMGAGASGATTPTGSGQDVGSGQDMSWLSGGDNPLMQGDPTGWGMGPVQQGGGDWGSWNGGGNDPWAGQIMPQGQMQQDNTGFGGQPLQESVSFGPGGANYGRTGWGNDPYAGQSPQTGGNYSGGLGAWAQPTATADPSGGGATRPSGGNTTGDAYAQWQQAMQQWQQQNQAYQQYQQAYQPWQQHEQAFQQYGQQEAAWKNNWDQFYGNWRQNFGQPGYDVGGLAQWRQTNPEPTAVQDPGAAPTAVQNPGAAPTAPQIPQPQRPNPLDAFSQWLTQQAHQPYQAPAAPQIPSFQNFSGMDPFQQAGLQTQARLAGIAWPQYQNQMRQEWGREGVTQPQIQSPLSMANLQNNTLNNLSWGNVLSVFGQTPQQYNTTYSPYWSQAQASGVNGIMGGGY